MQLLTTLKRWVQSTIGVSSKEANAFLILIPALFFVVFSQPLYRWLGVGSKPLTVQESFLLDSLISSKEVRKLDKSDSTSLFLFDPNTATINELTSLGISPFVAKRIDQYRIKGGKFRIKSDLQKMYGFDSSVYRKLIPYIDLPDKIVTQPKSDFPKIPIRVVEYDLNKADTADLKTIKGIGVVLAGRIVKYRQSLGGFVNQSQLREVFGLDSLVIQELSVFHISPEFQPERVRINYATDKELDKHPYISLAYAKAIVTYRMQHGKFTTISDLSKVRLLNEDFIRRITPYISFE